MDNHELNMLLICGAALVIGTLCFVVVRCRAAAFENAEYVASAHTLSFLFLGVALGGALFGALTLLLR